MTEKECTKKCYDCINTELPNIKDSDCESIGYSYAYKTDCEGKRYIKVDEVRRLLAIAKADERNKIFDRILNCVALPKSTKKLIEEMKGGAE